MSNPEINKVLYPGTPSVPQFDSIRNWPATVGVTQTTGEDITRNRDALLILEKILGPNPHIGLFTKDVTRATVAERLNVLESGISEGKFILKTLKVENAIEAVQDLNQMVHVILGTIRTNTRLSTDVTVNGPLIIKNSGMPDPRTQFEVGFRVYRKDNSTECQVEGKSEANKPLFRIKDTNQAYVDNLSYTALEIIGNVKITGSLTANFAIDHTTLKNINTDPSLDPRGHLIREAIHVSRGNYHSHKRGNYDNVLKKWFVDPNPEVDTYGLINHTDLEPLSVRVSNKQQDFLPSLDIAYHVTNGDDHDHIGGDGAPIQHKFLLGIDPKISDHVTSGDYHTHDPIKGDGGFIHSQSILLEKNKQADFLILTTPNNTSPVDPRELPVAAVTAEMNFSGILTTIDGILNNVNIIDKDQELRIKKLENFISDVRLTQVYQTIDQLYQTYLSRDGSIPLTGNWSVNTITSGGVLSSNFRLMNLTAPIDIRDATNKEYVDGKATTSQAGIDASIARDNSRPPTANISFNSKKLIDLALCTADTDGANKLYVDTKFSSVVVDHWLLTSGVSFVAPANGLYEITCIGGGGGGGGGGGQSDGPGIGGSGGGGGAVTKRKLYLTAGSYTISIGAAGVAGAGSDWIGNDGLPGGTTSFDAGVAGILYANGGSGGPIDSWGLGGLRDGFEGYDGARGGASAGAGSANNGTRGYNGAAPGLVNGSTDKAYGGGGAGGALLSRVDSFAAPYGLNVHAVTGGDWNGRMGGFGGQGYGAGGGGGGGQGAGLGSANGGAGAPGAIYIVRTST